MKRLGVLASVVALVVWGGISSSAQGKTSGNAEDEVPGAFQLVDRAFNNLYGEDYVQTLVLSTRGVGEREMRRRLQITRKQSVRPGKALLRFMAPYEVKGTSILIVENEGRSDDLFVYLPAVRLTKHLTTAQRADAFFGTDLIYEDIEPKSASDYKLGSGRWDKVKGLDCVKIEMQALPDFGSSYDWTVSCIEPERGVILQTEFYRGGALVKTLSVDPAEIRAVGSTYVAFSMNVRNHERRTETTVVTESYEPRPAIPDRLFSMWNLEAGDAQRDWSRSIGRDASQEEKD